jgi:hypothetical protein
MTAKRFRLYQSDDLSEEYVCDDGNPLRTDEEVELLNRLHEENQTLRAFIKRLTNNCGEIVLMNGVGYKVDKILEDLE